MQTISITWNNAKAYFQHYLSFYPALSPDYSLQKTAKTTNPSTGSPKPFRLLNTHAPVITLSQPRRIYTHTHTQAITHRNMNLLYMVCSVKQIH